MVRILQLCCALWLLVAFHRLAIADVPNEITVQGVLRDHAGNVQSMPIDLTVKFFDAATGGQMVTPPFTMRSVAVVGGLFSQVISDENLVASLAAVSNVWMEITTVTPDGTDVFPRQKLTPAVYALLCSTADRATRATTADNALQLNGVPASAWTPTIADPRDGMMDVLWPSPGPRWDPIGPVIEATSHGKGFFLVALSGTMIAKFAADVSSTYQVGLKELGGPSSGDQINSLSMTSPINLTMESPIGLTWIATTNDSGLHKFQAIASLAATSSADGRVRARLVVAWFPSP